MKYRTKATKYDLLRQIALCQVVTLLDVAHAFKYSDRNNAQKALVSLRKDRLIEYEIGPYKGGKTRNWSLTERGFQRLRYYQAKEEKEDERN